MGVESTEKLAELASNPFTHASVDRQVETPIVERVAQALGCGWLATRISSLTPFHPRPWVLYYVVLVVFDAGVIQGIRMATGRKHIIVINPLWVVTPIALGVLAFGIVYMYDQYERAVREAGLNDRTDGSVNFHHLVPRRLLWGVYFVGLLFYAGFVAVLGIDHILRVDGLVAGILVWAVLFPLVYLPLGVEFAATFFAVEFLLPRRLTRGNFELNFLDPEALGGLRPVGELLKSAYYLAVVSVLLYLLAIYGPTIFSEWVSLELQEPGAFAATMFTLLWATGIVSIGHAMITLHRYMQKERRLKLVELQHDQRSVIKNAEEIRETQIDDQEQFEQKQFQIDQVKNTKEYPATLTMWSHILLSILLPKAIQLALTGL
jgi:hypothetical protein